MDVEILRRACIAFRKNFLDIGNTDSFVSATTIASSYSYVFRKNFLKANTIGILPPAGSRRTNKHSQKAVEWLLQCEREIGREIIHAGRAGKYRLPEGFLVDGYLPPPSTTASVKGVVFEYQGCYTHRYVRCFVNKRDTPTAFNRTHNEAYENTRSKIDKI